MEVNEKYVAGGGTTALGIIGTALGGLNTLAGGNGIPFLGGARNAEQDAKIAKLESERYTDASVIAAQAREAAIRELETKNAEDIKAMRTEFELRAENDRLQSKINLLEATEPLKAQLAAHTTELSGVRDVLKGITRIYVPSSAVIPAKA